MSSLSTLNAVDVAVESIKVRKDLPEKTKKEAIERLRNMSGRDWYIRWDKESIIKALNDYKEKTGRAPTVTNLVETGMPKNLTIQSHFHIRASEFLKQLFPENRNLKKNAKPYSKFGFETEEEWLNCFAEQFKKHLCPDMCSKKYDLLRDKGTPTWSTIAKHCKMTSWKELMEAAGVKFYVRR